MAGRNRPSPLKRERESNKRQRRQKKAEKAAEKRERRKLAAESGSLAPAAEDLGDDGVPLGTPSVEKP